MTHLDFFICSWEENWKSFVWPKIEKQQVANMRRFFNFKLIQIPVFPKIIPRNDKALNKSSCHFSSDLRLEDIWMNEFRDGFKSNFIKFDRCLKPKSRTSKIFRTKFKNFHTCFIIAEKADVNPTSSKLSIRFARLEPELSDLVSSKLKLWN